MFWKLTPREFAAVLEGQHRRELRGFSLDVATAWHGAAFARAKKLPDLEKLLRRITGTQQAPRQQTPEEMLAIIERWTAAFGGEDHTTGLPN